MSRTGLFIEPVEVNLWAFGLQNYVVRRWCNTVGRNMLLSNQLHRPLSVQLIKTRHPRVTRLPREFTLPSTATAAGRVPLAMPLPPLNYGMWSLQQLLIDNGTV